MPRTSNSTARTTALLCANLSITETNHLFSNYFHLLSVIRLTLKTPISPSSRQQPILPTEFELHFILVPSPFSINHHVETNSRLRLVFKIFSTASVESHPFVTYSNCSSGQETSPKLFSYNSVIADLILKPSKNKC